VSDGVLLAKTAAVGGRMDLLSVLAHELGHAAGLEHAEDGLMDAQLAAGTRVAPAPATAEDASDALPFAAGPQEFRPGQALAPIVWTLPVRAADLPTARKAASPADWRSAFVNWDGEGPARHGLNTSLRIELASGKREVRL
jgi:hypothetical protein